MNTDNLQVHPLLTVQVNCIQSWPHWLELWNQPLPYQLKMGLLHYIFEIPYMLESAWDRIRFLFEVADGYDNYFSLQGTDDFEDRKFGIYKNQHGRMEVAPAHIRVLLAEKALAMLAASFFKVDWRCDDGPRPIPAWKMDSPVIEAVLHFFRSDNGVGLYNLRHVDEPRHQHARAAKEYILAVCKEACEQCFEHVAYRERLSDQALTHLNGLFPQFVEILYCLGEIDRIRPYERHLTEESLIRINQLAVGKGHDCHPSIEAAMLAGNRAAWLYHGLMTVRQERLRQEEIAEARREEEEARQRREALEGSKSN